MVFSRPIRSETHPQKGRQRPLISRSAESAKVSAAMDSPKSVTVTLSTLKSFAIGANCAVAINPPVATIAIITYISQKCGVAAISPGLKSRRLWRPFTSGLPFSLHVLGSQPVGGAFRNSAAITTIAP